MPFFDDPEAAMAASIKGREANKERARRRKEDPLWGIRKALPSLMDDLLDAVHGTGDYSGRRTIKVACPSCGTETSHKLRVESLPPDKRLAALFKAIEYAVGRPEPVSKTAAKIEPAAVDSGLTIE